MFTKEGERQEEEKWEKREKNAREKEKISKPRREMMMMIMKTTW